MARYRERIGYYADNVLFFPPIPELGREIGRVMSSVMRVQTVLSAHGLTSAVVELSESTRTAQQAAVALGVNVGQIVKSLVFRGSCSGAGLMCAVSGANRVDEAKMTGLFGESIERATPEFVRRATGFAIGGVAPIGHLEMLPVFIDKDLNQYSEIWAAAGSPHTIFCLSPLQLVALSGGCTVDLKA